ncbi:hypothetical protein [Desulfocucumis palustris]|uniref:hypothetical protein n=1 Tax=Desulfocucumis palustris TaxID=1898651 RepID=UPI000CE9B01E|nr:hypothetical protein [Desulfocucumis palustris]
MSATKLSFPVILGFFLGFVLFGVQVSLDGVNNAVAPENPYKLCSVRSVGAGELDVVLLGRPVRLTLPVPGSKECLRYMEEGIKKLSSLSEDLRAKGDRLWRTAEEYCRRKIIFDGS